MIASLSSVRTTETGEEAEARELASHEHNIVQTAGFGEAYDAVIGNCSMCHARDPVWGNMRWAPKGVYLETPGDIVRHAHQIYLHAGTSHSMPQPNAIEMKMVSRQAIVDRHARLSGKLKQ